MIEILVGDCRRVLRKIPGRSVDCVVTSPPYWLQREYDPVPGTIGLESTLEAYVAALVDCMRAVRRVMKSDATLFLNLGDVYVGSRKGSTGKSSWLSNPASQDEVGYPKLERRGASLKRGDLALAPHRVAIALQEDGWFVRQDVVWEKPNHKPESVRDRPTRCHEYVFVFSKTRRYWWDKAAIAEASEVRWRRPDRRWNPTKNRRSVWKIPTVPYGGRHTAPMPPELARLCLLAGCRPGGLALDPFAGSGVVGIEAVGLGRRALLVEVSPEAAEDARRRIATEVPLLARAETSHRPDGRCAG